LKLQRLLIIQRCKAVDANQSLKISTGIRKIDDLLSGGLPFGLITHVFGPRGSGKTLFSLHCALSAASHGRKVFYIDADHSLHPRMLLNFAPKNVLDRIMLAKPNSFAEQEKLIERLYALLPPSSLVIVDSIASMYRLELGEKEQNIAVNRKLNLQLAELLDLAQETPSSILLTNHVAVDPELECVRPVGGNVVSYWSAIELKLERLMPGKIRATLVKGKGNVNSSAELTIKGRKLI